MAMMYTFRKWVSEALVLVGLTTMGSLGHAAPPIPSDRYATDTSLGYAYGTFERAVDASPTAANSSVSSPVVPGMSAQARADGTLGVFATARSDNYPNLNYPGNMPTWQAVSMARLRIVDAFVSGPTTSVSAPMMGLFLDGTLDSQIVIDSLSLPSAQVNAYSQVRVSVSVSGQGVVASGFREVATGGIGPNISDGRTKSGFLANDAFWASTFGNDSIFSFAVTDPIEFPVNEYFEIDLEIAVAAATFVSYPYDTSQLSTHGVARTDFLNTIGFGTGRPVLGLPDGYTFDAESAGIVDNMCVGTSCISSAVPEGGSATYFALGLLALALARRAHPARAARRS